MQTSQIALFGRVNLNGPKSVGRLPDRFTEGSDFLLHGSITFYNSLELKSLRSNDSVRKDLKFSERDACKSEIFPKFGINYTIDEDAAISWLSSNINPVNHQTLVFKTDNGRGNSF